VKVVVLQKMREILRSILGLVNVLLIGFWGYTQPANDACNNAIELCPNLTVSGTNIGATATVCPDCEDDLTFCFIGTNSVWYSFTTNSTGGNVTISFTNLAFNPGATLGTQLQSALFQAAVPCDASSFTLVSNCVSNATTNFSLNAPGLAPNTEYIFVVNGAINGSATQPARATFDVNVSGPGADRLPVGLSVGGPSGEVCPKNPVGFAMYLSNCTDTSNIVWTINGVPAASPDGPYWSTSALQDGDVIAVSCTCFSVCPQDYSYTFGAVAVNDLYVDAGSDQYVTSGSTVTLAGTTNGTDYAWTPASEVLTPYNLSTITVPQTTTTYFLTATNATCALSDEVTVYITDVLEIPGSFSPNGDGVNDLWEIPGIDNYPNAQVKIYTRWGQVTADITGYSHTRAWDGMTNGKPVPDGVYFYELNLHDKSSNEVRKGNVTVLR